MRETDGSSPPVPAGRRALESVVLMVTRQRTRSRVAALLTVVVLVGCSGSSQSGSPSSTIAGGSDRSTSSTSAGPVTTVPQVTTVPVVTTTAAPTTTTAPPDPTTVAEPAGPLQSGSKGLRTRALQQALTDQHYDPGPVDGAFGRKVTQAVWAFQALHGVPKDGIVTPELEVQIAAKAPQPMLRPELGPSHTEIDLKRQVLIVWRDGAPRLITHVSSGSQVAYCEKTSEGRRCGNAVTPTGVYRYQRRVDGWRDAPLGRLYKPVYFNGGIAVHGAGSVPNGPASHGCVRLPMSIAEYFPTLVANGETIEVFRS